MTPERRIEKKLYDMVKARRGMCIKLAPTHAGLPDRLVVLPEGRIFFVELKAPTGRLRPIQRAMHEMLRGLGAQVMVFYSVEQAEFWLQHIDQQSRGVL